MFKNLKEVMIANAENGFKTFDPEIEKQFNGRIESDLFVGKYFITFSSNRLTGGDFFEGYSVRGAFYPSGKIYKVGASREFKEKADALARIRSIIKKEQKSTH